jgi:hypothetical protein
MKKIEINSIIEANEWFISAQENDVVKVLETQPVLSGLVQVIIEEDLKDSEEYSKDLFYSLYGTILKTYITNFGDDFKEITEEDIDFAFEKQNKFAELLSKSLGFTGDLPSEAEEQKAVEMMEKLSDLEEKFNNDDSFDLEKEGLGDLAELMGQVNEEMKQPSLNAFLQSELEEADLEDNSAGFINQQFAIIVDAIETMLDRTNSDKADMKIV